MRFLLAMFTALSSLAVAQDFKPNLGPDIPQFTITCGDVSLLMRQKSQWTPGRIDFRGKAMTTERSAYGTVFMFPEIGFIGTAHLENEPENLQSIEFYLDDDLISEPEEAHTGKTFRCVRQSKIRAFDLENITELRNDRLYETVTVSAKNAAPLKLVYHFMHAWRPTCSAYLAGVDSGPDTNIAGPLDDAPETARHFFVQQEVDWFAIYEPESGQFAVSRLLESPDKTKSSSKVWNVPGTYRKYYLTSFQNKTVPAGFTGKWRMVTAFGASDFEGWEVAARKLAKELKE